MESNTNISFSFPGDLSTAKTDAAIGSIDDTELAGGDAVGLLVHLKVVAAVGTGGEKAGAELGDVANLKQNAKRRLLIKRIKGDPVHIAHHEPILLLRLRVIAAADVDDVLLDVFLDDEPRATAEIEAFTLADGVEPEALVLAEDLAGFEFDDRTFLLAKEALDELVVVDLAEEADALRVLAMSRRELGFFGNATHLTFGHRADREKAMADLQAGELREEVGLVFDWIWGGAQERVKS